MSGGVRYQLVSWKPPPDAGGLKQGLRDCNARVLVYKGKGVPTYRLLCSNKVAKGLLQDSHRGPYSEHAPWVEQGSMTWDGYKKITDEILVGNAMEVAAAVEEETQFVPSSSRGKDKVW